MLTALHSFLHYHASTWHHFPHSIWNVSFHCLRASIVFEMLTVNHNVGFLCFSSAILEFFSLALELHVDTAVITVKVSR